MTQVFVSYNHRDEVWKDRLAAQLGVLQGLGIDAWHDRRIDAGDAWEAQIAAAIAGCDAAVLLISPHVLGSQFILEKEIPPLLKRHRQGQVRLIPLIVGPCQWQRVDWMAPLQARPKDGAPLSGMRRHGAEDALSSLAGEIADAYKLTASGAAPFVAAAPPATHLNNLPLGGTHLYGRATELAALDEAWASAGHTHIVALIAPGGTGKTALVRDWLLALSQDDWRGARRVYGWSFYSQRTSDDRQASEDAFLAAAVEWFGIDLPANADVREKGGHLAQALREQRCLLLLDGIEPLQYPPRSHAGLAGRLRAPGLQTLLQDLAQQPGRSLCVLTSREHLTDLASFVRQPERPAGSVVAIDLNNLDAADGACLLHAQGATRAGAVAIGADDAELIAASREVKGHALTLALLGRYLALAFGGDIRQRDQVDFRDADADAGD